MNHRNTIEINGKLYDAKNGLLLSSTTNTPQTFHPKPTIDGVITAKQKTKSQRNPNIRSSKSKAVHNTRKHRNTQKSHTLIRYGVKKPESGKTKTHEIKSFSRSRSTKEVDKSPFVSKFSASHSKPVIKAEHVAVTEAPKPSNRQLTVGNIDKSAKPRKETSHKHNESIEEIFQKAIAQTPPRRKHNKQKVRKARKIGKTATLTATFLILFGFIAYLNFADIQVKLASTQAGFDAAMPDYTVSGYKMKNLIDTEPGKVSISFTSNTDDRSYTVNEEVSKWSSSALQENYLSARNITYQTTQDAGKTIFLYDNGNATWVNGGVWYTINSNALSTDQLVNIASSL
ncbi:DUF4367 domain-containing protein [Candidatus Saccharibacteria bacterium]|nr:DUF4367 domain-containing protein [Candidatus Saccharibacteria bacterium]